MLDIPKTADKLRKLAADQTIVRFPEAPVPAETREKGVPAKGGKAPLKRGMLLTKPKSLLKKSFLALVVLPTLIASIYFAFFAADQYAVTAQFAVRSKESNMAAVEGLSLLSGIAGSSSTSSDSYVVTNYIESRDLISAVDKDLDLRQLFSRPEADFWASVDREAPIEDLVEYWEGMVYAEYETFSGIVELEVKAFRPDDAKVLAERILLYSEKLVNEMSRRARADAVREAEDEVQRSEMRLRLARKAISTFRGEELRLNPVATAESREKILGELEAQLARLQTELTTLKSISPNSPRLASTKSQEQAVRQQIIALRGRTVNSDTANEATLNTQLTAFEELETERMFAEKAFVSSLASLEQARIEASAQNRYLSVFVQPQTPDTALYPERLRWIAVIFFLCFVSWGIGSLIVAGVRDHMV